MVLLSFDFCKDEDWKTFAWVKFQPLDFFKGNATVTAHFLFMTCPLHTYAPQRMNPEAKTSVLHIKWSNDGGEIKLPRACRCRTAALRNLPK